MKLLVVVFLISTLAVAVKSGLNSDEAIAAFRSLSTTCKEETGATDADIEAMIRHEPAGTMEAKCLAACIMKKVEVMDANGKFVKDVAMKMAELHIQDAAKLLIAEEITNICKDIAVSTNHCEAAEQYGLCMKDEVIKRGRDPNEF